MAGPVRIAILANGSQARRELGTVGTSLGRLGKMGKSAALLGFGALTVGAVGFAKSAVETEAKFSTSMRLIQAATKASGTEMSAMNDLAVKLGAETAFSAGEAADAMLDLAKAGLDTNTIMGGGLAGTLTLAAAGGTELGTAATIASNALNTFNLQGKDMAKVAAALAGGANASSASVESLGQGLQQVGPGATNAGLSLQETVAALAAFDAAGIKGSDAGTSLKTMLARLVPSTEKARDAMADLNLKYTDAQGNFLPLTEIAERTQRAFKGLSEEQRTAKLTTIFGSDATRAATVLMKEGAGGLRDYIRATQDQAAAEKMAKARMGGTAGAMERLSGAVETAKLRLGQELAPAITAAAGFLSDNMVPAMEAVIQGGKDLGTALGPAAEEIGEAFRDLLPSANEAGDIFKNHLVPAVRSLAEIVGGVVGFINDLPGPLKSLAVQAGVAALVLPRLSAGLTSMAATATTATARIRQLHAEMSYGPTRAQNMTSAIGRLKSAATTAAGIGGLMALTSGFADASTEGLTFGGVLKGAAGGAGIGAMFGPVGALVGAGVGGGLTALTGAFSDAGNEAEKTRLELLKAEGFTQAKADADSLRESLTGVVNVYGAIPRAAVQASFTGEEGKLDKDVAALRELGVSMDTIVSATMGQADAQRIVNTALTEGLAAQQSGAAQAKAAYDAVKDGATDLVTATGQVIKNGQTLTPDQVNVYRKAWEDAKQPVENLTAAQETFRNRVTENTGAIQSHKARIADLAGQLGITVKRYKQFPKAVRTKVEAEDLPQTSRDALRLIGQYRGLQKFRNIKAVISAPGVDVTRKDIIDLGKKYKLTPREVRTLIRLEARQAQKANQDARRDLDETGRKTAKPKIEPDASRVPGIVASTVRMLNGISDEDVWINIRTRRVGDGGGGGGDVGAGITPRLGLEKIPPLSPLERGGLEKRGNDIVRQLLVGVTAGASGVSGALDKITKLIEKRVKLKDAEKEAARERAVLQNLKGQYAALRRNGRAQEANARALDAQREKYKGLLTAANQYAASIKSAFVEFGSIISLGAGTGFGSLDQMFAQWGERAKQAERFQAVIAALSKTKLNRTVLEQILGAGVEGGLGTAEALLAGGTAAIDQANKLSDRFAAAGAATGALLREKYHQAGLDSAAGFVAGLEATQKRLDRIARQMANALAKAVKKALGIKSPSRVFRGIGEDTIKGLALGLDETYVRRQGGKVAASLEQGFGTPALEAYAAARSAGAGGGDTFQINVTVPVGASPVETGRQIVKAIEAYEIAGGRKRASA